ncbi:uncharacterized protein LOC142467265 isoform X1 [Ascaphus truei]|uniref:uncharacterized protein LOC142467265 isoform X1 n=1 Tax=Ascaphus truei TaxID=8439 RepID=UPI003F590364
MLDGILNTNSLCETSATSLRILSGVHLYFQLYSRNPPPRKDLANPWCRVLKSHHRPPTRESRPLVTSHPAALILGDRYSRISMGQQETPSGPSAFHCISFLRSLIMGGALYTTYPNLIKMLTGQSLRTRGEIDARSRHFHAPPRGVTPLYKNRNTSCQAILLFFRGVPLECRRRKKYVTEARTFYELTSLNIRFYQACAGS